MINIHTFQKLAIATLLAAGIPAAQAADSIDYAAAVRQALARNPAAAASAARTEAAAGGVEAARGAGLPRLSLQVNAMRSNDPLNVFGFQLRRREASFADLGLGEYTGPASLNTAPDALNEPGYDTNVDTALALTVPLYAGGGDSARLEAARAQLAASRHQDAFTRQQLAVEVLRCYQGVFAARQMASAATQARDAAERFLATAQALENKGMALKSDVLTARSHLAQARTAEQAARADVANALDAFHSIIGVGPDSDIEPGVPVDLPAPAGDLAELAQRAESQNLRLQTLQAQLHASDAALDAASARNLPRVDLTLRRDWNADAFTLDTPSNTALLTLSWDLFTSGTQQGATRQARGQRNAVAADLRNSRDQLHLQVARAVRGLDTAAARVTTRRNGLAQAREAARLIRLRYAQGLSTLNDMLSAQARLDQARAGLIQARYDLLLAKADLRLLLNDFSPDAVSAATDTTEFTEETP